MTRLEQTLDRLDDEIYLKDIVLIDADYFVKRKG